MKKPTRKINKVLICTAQVPFVYGGAEILVEELKLQLTKRGYEAEIVQIPFNNNPPEELLNQALIWRQLSIEEVDGAKSDLVICTKYPAYVVNHPNKVIWLFHQYRQIYELADTEFSGLDSLDEIQKERIIGKIKNIDRQTLSEAKKIFTISKNVSNRLKLSTGFESEVLYPPIKNKEKFKNGEFRDYIFVAGRLNKMKRYEEMIKAMPQIDDHIRFVIAGKGPHLDELKKLTKKLGVDDRVEFRGFVSHDELIELYQHALAIYFAPYDEDYGYITIEAFQSKKPVLTFPDSGGVLEFVKNNESGYICKDVDELAKRVNELYANKDLAERMGLNGYNLVNEINWDSVIESLLG